MIIVIVGDPSTGACNMMMEGVEPPMARQILEQMCQEIDRKFNNGQPPPRASGLIVPAHVPPPPPSPMPPMPISPLPPPLPPPLP